MADQPPKSKKLVTVIKGLVALVVTVACLYVAFKDLELDHVTTNLRKTSLPVVAVFVLGVCVIHVIRIIRWGLLVVPLGQPSWRAIFAAASVGIPGAFFVPLRLGEFIRPVMISRAGVPFAGAMASVVVERIADGLINIGIFFVLLRVLPTEGTLPDEILHLLDVALIGFVGGLLVLVAAFVARGPVLSLLRRILEPISETVAEKVLNLLSTFLDGLAVLGSVRRVAAFILLTIAYWGLNGTITYLLVESYAPGIPFFVGLFTISVVVFAVTIPAGPAFLGSFELGFVLGLSQFGVSRSISATVAIVAHALQLVLFAAFVGMGLLAADPSQQKDAPPEEA